MPPASTVLLSESTLSVRKQAAAISQLLTQECASPALTHMFSFFCLLPFCLQSQVTLLFGALVFIHRTRLTKQGIAFYLPRVHVCSERTRPTVDFRDTRSPETVYWGLRAS